MSIVRKLINLLIVGVMIATTSFAVAAPEEPRPEAPNAHYLVFEINNQGTAVLLFRKEVQLATKPVSTQNRQRRPHHHELHLDVTLKDKEGRELFVDRVFAPNKIRNEFDQLIDSHQGIHDKAHHGAHKPNVVALDSVTVVVRVPIVADSKLTLEGTTRQSFDMNTLAAEPQASTKLIKTPSFKQVRAGLGNPANRLDVLVMGDGYTAQQQAAFDADVAEFVEGFFGITPYAEYRNHVNVSSLFTASNESGADHPSFVPGCGDSSCCTDPAAANDPLEGTFADTLFDARYCSFNIQRLLTVNTGSVFSAASAVPDWDIILMLVNDPVYGGSGGSVPVASQATSTVLLVQHEFGHSFTALADEYDLAFPGFPSCSDTSGFSPCEANVTNETTREQIKWSPWIDTNTPVPTPETSQFNNDVGLFEGARYLTSNMYRPKNNCLMQSLSSEFCEVCSQSYVLRLYDGGWGTPVNGIDIIEPGLEVPAVFELETDANGVTLSIETLEPDTIEGLTVEWLIDGVPQPGESNNSFLYIPEGSEVTADVSVVVTDSTALVHPQMATANLQSSRTWSISYTANTDTDADGLRDFEDNCSLVVNANQIDADNDGFGNVCDPDLNNDLIVNFIDVSLFAALFNSTDSVADFNVDGAVNFLDFSIMANSFLGSPGPGATGD